MSPLLVALALAAPETTTVLGPAPPPDAIAALGIGEAGPEGVTAAVRLLVLFTGMAFLPAMVVVMTPFVRFVVVLSLLRQALGLNQSPPNQVIIGLALFLSMSVMQPTLEASWAGGVAPFLDGRVPVAEAMDGALGPLRQFMLANTRRADMAAALEIARLAPPDALDDVPTPVVVSAYVLSELKTALLVSVYVFVPFLVVDLVVSSVLMGMGMMMLPPAIVSLPLKLVVFVVMDGWALLARDLAAGIVR